jgi:hypothetical protein
LSQQLKVFPDLLFRNLWVIDVYLGQILQQLPSNVEFDRQNVPFGSC